MERQEKVNELTDFIKSHDVDLGLDPTYTLEQFESDFDLADSIEDKNKVLEKGLDNFDVFTPGVKETFLKFRNEIKDYQLEIMKETDLSCNKDIDSGSCELYKCIKPINNFVEGMTYYVKIDEPLIWIISDGIDTLKTKNVFLDNFSDYFQK